MTHAELVLRACRWLRSAKACAPVFAEFQHMAAMEMPDAIGWTTAGTVHVVEAKVSRADYRREAKKWHRRTGSSMGHKRWYVAPRGVIEPNELDGHGLLEPSGRGLRVVVVAPVRTMEPWTKARARREEHAILRNAIARHEKGVAWHRDTFRFAPLKSALP